MSSQFKSGADNRPGRGKIRAFRWLHGWIRPAVALLLITAGATLLWAATDSEFEAAAGLDKALTANPPTMTADGDIEGKTFEVANAFGQSGCTAKCEFTIAKSGTYPYAAGRTLIRGIYVKIKTTFDKTKCEGRCEEVKVLQVFRDFSKDANQAKQIAASRDAERNRRAGLDANGAALPGAASPGWQIDTADVSPFYGPGFAAGSAESGSTDTPLIERDAPGEYTTTANRGCELIACAVCANKVGKARIIGCVTFGYYVDDKRNIAFEPKPPTTSGTAPQQVKDALERFEKLPNSKPGNIQF